MAASSHGPAYHPSEWRTPAQRRGFHGEKHGTHDRSSLVHGAIYAMIYSVFRHLGLAIIALVWAFRIR